MSKLLSFLNRNNTDDNTDAIRRTATATMAHLLERNRKFELFLVEKLAELEKRTGPGRQAQEPASSPDDSFAPLANPQAEEPEPAWDSSLDDDELFAPRSSLVKPGPVAPSKPSKPAPVAPVVVNTPMDWTALFGLGNESEPERDATEAGANSLPNDDGAKGEFD